MKGNNSKMKCWICGRGEEQLREDMKECGCTWSGEKSQIEWEELIESDKICEEDPIIPQGVPICIVCKYILKQTADARARGLLGMLRKWWYEKEGKGFENFLESNEAWEEWEESGK